LDIAPAKAPLANSLTSLVLKNACSGLKKKVVRKITSKSMDNIIKVRNI
jgi:hypothetical protein